MDYFVPIYCKRDSRNQIVQRRLGEYETLAEAVNVLAQQAAEFGGYGWVQKTTRPQWDRNTQQQGVKK